MNDQLLESVAIEDLKMWNDMENPTDRAKGLCVFVRPEGCVFKSCCKKYKRGKRCKKCPKS